MYWRFGLRWWWLVLLISLFCAFLGYEGTIIMMEPVYGSSLVMQVVSPPNYAQLGTSADAITDALIMTTAPVKAETAKHLSADARRDPGALGSVVCYSDVPDRFVTCQSRSNDPLAAAAALNDLARTFTQVNRRDQQAFYAPQLRNVRSQETVLRTQIDSLQSRLTMLQQKSSQSLTDQYQITALQSQITQDQGPLSSLTTQEATLRGQMVQAQNSARVVNPAVPNTHQIDPHPARDAFISWVGGLILGLALVVGLELLDPSFRSTDEIGEIIGLPVLANVRRCGGPTAELPTATWTRPRSAIAEAFRIARTNLQFVSVDHPITVLLVTSSSDGEGKTTAAANLGIAFAMAGKRVLLVDADLHRAGLSTIFGLQDVAGLSHALADPSVGVPACETEIPRLRVVPSGLLPPNPAELLGSHRMREWVQEAAETHDLVILDTPPILSVADTRDLTKVVDGVVLVVCPDVTNRHWTNAAKDALNTAGARILGMVVNKTRFRGEAHYGYNRYYLEREPAQPAGKARA